MSQSLFGLSDPGVTGSATYEAHYLENQLAISDIISNFDQVENMKVDDTFDLISSCIDQVYSDEETWSHQECTKKELSDFVESLNTTQFKKVENFFTTMPKLSHLVKVTNPNTNVDSEIKLEGLQSFFA